jgi:uncharacterized protein (UPF0248 family)
MKPIQEILSRIRWDKNLSEDKFKIAYYDRLEKDLIVVPFEQVRFAPDDHFCFYIVDEEGETHSIPYHRVKALYQNDKLIWHRN